MISQTLFIRFFNDLIININLAIGHFVFLKIFFVLGIYLENSIEFLS